MFAIDFMARCRDSIDFPLVVSAIRIYVFNRDLLPFNGHDVAEIAFDGGAGQCAFAAHGDSGCRVGIRAPIFVLGIRDSGI